MGKVMDGRAPMLGRTAAASFVDVGLGGVTLRHWLQQYGTGGQELVLDEMCATRDIAPRKTETRAVSLTFA